MPSVLENQAIDGLLLLNPSKTKHQLRYEMRCAYLEKARAVRMAKIAARKVKPLSPWMKTKVRAEMIAKNTAK